MKRLSRLCLALVAAVALFVGCSDEPAEEGGVDKSRTPDEVFTDFVTQESDSGVLLWSLTAPEGERFKSQQVVVLDRPKIVFYDETGQAKTTLTSDAGEYFEDRRDMLAYGNVVVRSVDGEILETDSLLWDNSQKKIFSDSFVKLTRGRNVITGYGLECKDDLDSVEIKRDVKATVIDEEGEITE